MKFPVDLATVRADPQGFAEAVFGLGGLAAGVLPRHSPNKAQMAYAAGLVRSASRGLDGGTVGRVTLLEASTGVGKSIAYLVVGLTFAILTRRRFMVSTYTRALMHQLVTKEAEYALRIVRTVTGHAADECGGMQVRLAPRRSRGAFVSPSRARHHAQSLDAEHKTVQAGVLRHYADLTEACLERARKREGAAEVVAELDGTIEAFDALWPEEAEILREVPSNDYVLNELCPESEQVLWRAYRDVAKGAIGLVLTHAATLTELSTFGRGMAAYESKICLFVLDEAHALPRAAASVFSDKISLKAAFREAGSVFTSLGGEAEGYPEDGPRRQVALEAAEGYEEAVQALLEAVISHVKDMDRDSKAMVITGEEEWIGMIRAARQALVSLVVALGNLGGEKALGTARELQKLDRPLNMLLDCIAWRRENKRPGIYTPQVSLTPIRRDPSLQVLPLRRERIVDRLWSNRGENEGAMADAVVFTSATLIGSVVRKEDGTQSLDRATYERAAGEIGIDTRKDNINYDLCGTFEPEIFGSPSFVFADPVAPYVRHDRAPDDGRVSVAAAKYVALAIAEAANRPNRRTGRARIVVPTKSFKDVAVLVEHLPAHLADRVVARQEGSSLQAALRAWRATEDGILITPGIHEGLNEPGLVDHLFVYRLPYDPPVQIDGVRQKFFNARAEMMRHLRQVIGRGVRNAEDAPTIWFMDVRFPVPERVRNRLEIPQSDVSQDPHVTGAVPERWKRAMDRGEVFPCPRSLVFARGKGPVTEEEAA